MGVTLLLRTRETRWPLGGVTLDGVSFEKRSVFCVCSENCDSLQEQEPDRRSPASCRCAFIFGLRPEEGPGERWYLPTPGSWTTGQHPDLWKRPMFKEFVQGLGTSLGGMSPSSLACFPFLLILLTHVSRDLRGQG